LLYFAVSPVISFARKQLGNQKTIEDELKLDARPSVVFLRPFAAEDLTFVEPKVTFEQYLGAAIRERIGPLVALGNPEDYLPRPGAIRTYADDEDWYEYFERLASQAACIVMMAANSDNLQRELTFVRREGLQHRLFIFTDLYGAPHGFYYTASKPIIWLLLQLYGPPRVDEKATWEQLAQSVKTLGFDLGDDPGRGAVVTFDPEGRASVLVKGAETPSEFVEPIREYLVDLDEVAAKAEGPWSRLRSANGAPSSA
jgi:hypothetical protein